MSESSSNLARRNGLVTCCCLFQGSFVAYVSSDDPQPAHNRDRLKTKGKLFILVSDLEASNKQQELKKSLNAYSVAKHRLGSHTC